VENADGMSPSSLAVPAPEKRLKFLGLEMHIGTFSGPSDEHRIDKNFK